MKKLAGRVWCLNSALELAINRQAGDGDQLTERIWRSNGVLEVATHLQAGNGNQMTKQEGRLMAEREW